MLTRTNALFGMWMIEKNELDKEGWDFLREGLDLPIGTPKAQIKSTLETFLSQTDTVVDTTPASVNMKYYMEASGEDGSKSGKDHWTYEASLDGDYDDSFGDANEGDGFWCLFLNPEQSFICRETPSGFWDIYADYKDSEDAVRVFDNLRKSYEERFNESAD